MTPLLPTVRGRGSHYKMRNEDLDEMGFQIEEGELDPVEENMFYPRGALNVIELLFEDETFTRPRGKKSPKFTREEVWAIADFLFFRSPYIELRVRKRLSNVREMPLKRKMFVRYLVGDAKFNAAKAARMAGYSPRSAKQIAYKIKQT